MNKVIVVGMGPGHPDYVLPVVQSKLKAFHTIVSNNRLVKTIEDLGVDVEKKKIIPMGEGRQLKETLEDIKNQLKDESVVVGVSGDTGFYSLLNYLKRFFSPEQIEVFPGISSVQYLFSKLGITYQDCKLLSLHGRETDLDEMLSKGTPICFLCDKDHGSSYVAVKLLELGIKRNFYVGECLSYPEEKITLMSPETAKSYNSDPMSVIYIPGD